jgi:sigma-B regulation protein RsbU (phosphoserine phosphatase)
VSIPQIDDFQDLFENAPCGYVVLLTNGRVERVNRTMLGWIGHPADQMIGKRFSDFFNMAGRIFYETHIAPLLRMQGCFSEFAIDVVGKDGKPVQMIANAVERRDDDGKPLFIRLALIKATDRRLYESQLLKARDDATVSLADERQTSELREQFIAVLGHDLRNPLASISAGARILGRDAKTDRDHQVVAMLQSTVVRMTGLIDNVLDFARGRLGGGITLDRNARAPLEPVLHQVIDELRLASIGREIVEMYALDEPIDCDRSRIGQMVSNLVGNAITHGASNQSSYRERSFQAERLQRW